MFGSMWVDDDPHAEFYQEYADDNTDPFWSKVLREAGYA